MKEHKEEKAMNEEELQMNEEQQTEEVVTKNEGQTGASEIDQLNAEIDSLKDKLLRQAAEFENYRKRTAKERIELLKTASEEVIASLLDVLDDTKNAELQFEKTTDLEALKEGVLLIFNKLRNTLKGRGLVEMECKGEAFDADLHEALTEFPVQDKKDAGKVIDVLRSGYYLNDKIIRHARVVVGKHE